MKREPVPEARHRVRGSSLADGRHEPIESDLITPRAPVQGPDLLDLGEVLYSAVEALQVSGQADGDSDDKKAEELIPSAAGYRRSGRKQHVTEDQNRVQSQPSHVDRGR